MRFEHSSAQTWGCQRPQKDYFNFLPVKKSEVKKSLRVILHSAGGGADQAWSCAFKNKHCFHFYASDDYHVLYLDCRVNKESDWWWGHHEIEHMKYRSAMLKSDPPPVFNFSSHVDSSSNDTYPGFINKKSYN
ncbi:hypothetical protein PQO03_04390 [Lentisphaera profundi]|uniref:Uncharacterized protein n=1 Tax=Lentisphaera profundi TaxID=1658616 RepID=A0ABY7VV77_9BACT|nr:hypothetical protein [Lentisphaera profundi]WDE97193.1 hypothetical protein PQO03_04390 [Lentisphaera profundi]